MMIQLSMALTLLTATHCQIEDNSVYRGCNLSTSKKCYSHQAGNDCITSRNCKMLITKEIISIDKETNAMFKGHQISPVDPDLVKFTVYLEPVNPLSGTINGYAIYLPLVDKSIKWHLTCFYDSSGHIVAKPCATASACHMVVTTVLAHGCQFLVPTNLVNETLTTAIDQNEAIEVGRVGQHGVEAYEKTNYRIVDKDYLTSDCEYSTTPKNMFCSSDNVNDIEVLFKVYRDQVRNRMRFYVHFKGVKPMPGLIALITPNHTSGLILCFAPNGSKVTVIHLKNRSTSVVVGSEIVTGNEMLHENSDGHSVRQVIEINHETLGNRHRINLVGGTTVYNYIVYVTKDRNVCQPRLTLGVLYSMQINSKLIMQAGNVTGTVTWHSGPDGSGQTGPDGTTKSGPGDKVNRTEAMSLMTIALICFSALLLLIAMAWTSYFMCRSKPSKNFEYISMYTDVQTVNSADIQAVFQNSQNSDSRKTQGTTGF
ncbi:hypothetical protein HDE_00785 [Halotydeus destructor]|nr:hypothetical protein HDE_00785 [Halotydeus destructor]